MTFPVGLITLSNRGGAPLRARLRVQDVVPNLVVTITVIGQGHV